MSENSQIIEPWNDEGNASLDERRGTFLKVLCILSWIWMGLQLFSNVSAYFGGPEKLMEAKSDAEDAFGSAEGSGFMKSVLEQAMVVLDRTIENFYAIYLGNIIALLIGVLAVYLMFTLKKIGFFLYVLYAAIAIGVASYYIGAATALMDIIVSIAFIIMYGVNYKRMTA
ncbi:MAG: hypothetical protein AB8B74_11285 [Crocinitomicaceae bacterium]